MACVLSKRATAYDLELPLKVISHILNLSVTKI